MQSRTIKVGEFEVVSVRAGSFRLDGGGMFGVVPKPLWERRIAADERNRIPLDHNCLLVRTSSETVLIETGLGSVSKLDEKMKDIYAAEDRDIVTALAEIDIDPTEIDRVILTHLHVDHAGGGTVQTPDGFEPTFPNARYLVQKAEWEDATSGDPQTRRGYRIEEDLLPVEREGCLDLLEGDAEVTRGIRVRVTKGHTRAHQSVLIESGGETLCYIGDLVPTTHHITPIYIMSLDLYPIDTYRVKSELLRQAAEEDWIVAWPHDVSTLWSRVREENGDFEARTLE